MFDLNQEITKWRYNLSQSETLGETDVDELESHLREEVKNLTNLTLSEEEAFGVAIHRLGNTACLTNEFAKVSRAMILKRRLFWMSAGILIYLLATDIAGALSQCCVLLAGMVGFGGYSVGMLRIVSQILVLGVMALFLCRVSKQDMWRDRFHQLVGNLTGKIVFLAGLTFIVILISASRILFTALTARIMHAAEFQRVSLISGYVRIILPILLPIILVMLLIKLRRSDLQGYGFN